MSELRELRKHLGMTIAQLSEVLQINERTLRRWETGEITTPHTVILLMRSLKNNS